MIYLIYQRTGGCFNYEKIGRLIYKLAMALCALTLMMTQDKGLGSDPFYPYLITILFGCCVLGAFIEMEDK